VIVYQIEQVLELPITSIGSVDTGISGISGVGGSFGGVSSGINSMSSQNHDILVDHADCNLK
jgi:hypothetical protein